MFPRVGAHLLPSARQADATWWYTEIKATQRHRCPGSSLSTDLPSWPHSPAGKLSSSSQWQEIKVRLQTPQTTHPTAKYTGHFCPLSQNSHAVATIVTSFWTPSSPLWQRTTQHAFLTVSVSPTVGGRLLWFGLVLFCLVWFCRRQGAKCQTSTYLFSFWIADAHCWIVTTNSRISTSSQTTLCIVVTLGTSFLGLSCLLQACILTLPNTKAFLDLPIVREQWGAVVSYTGWALRSENLNPKVLWDLKLFKHHHCAQKFWILGHFQIFGLKMFNW